MLSGKPSTTSLPAPRKKSNPSSWGGDLEGAQILRGDFSGGGFPLRFRDDRQGDHRLGHHLLASVALREDLRLRHVEGFPLPEDRRPAPEALPQCAPQGGDLDLDG